jgi:hypothetical protein
LEGIVTLADLEIQISTTHNYIGHRPGTIDEETFDHAIGSRTTTEREIVPISTDIAA